MIDGCPPRLPLSEELIQAQLDRRRPGQSSLTTPRTESDRVQILSGLFEGRTLGTPIMLWVANKDARPESYESFRHLYRPSHADYTYEAKYGIRNWQGGGRASARETVGRVAAGAVAEAVLQAALNLKIVAYVRRIGTIEAGIADPGGAGQDEAEGGANTAIDPLSLTRDQVDANPVRCPDPSAAGAMAKAIEAARDQGDSLGGVIETVVTGVPAGLGAPVFEKLEAALAAAMLSLPACKGFEVGSGFEGTRLQGSRHNDSFIRHPDGRIGTRTNRSGGIQGGISNGEPIYFRAAFKPTATISKPQETVDRQARAATLEARGRHDPCVLPRAVPLVEAMTALVLADHWLRQVSLEGAARLMERKSAFGAGGSEAGGAD